MLVLINWEILWISGFPKIFNFLGCSKIELAEPQRGTKKLKVFSVSPPFIVE
tara:strand:+ start:247 stop:402 length:156 start_codon:yes stop_codon:yes gene_type:complete